MSKIILENLSKSYSGSEKDIILDKLNLEVNSGNFISLSGHSGIGKSTLLYIIGGLIKASSGAVYFNGKNIDNFSKKEMDDYRRNVVSFIFQEYQFVQAMNLRDNLMFTSKLNTNLSDLKLEAKIDEYLKRLNLFERKFYLPRMLSGGQKRRAMFLSGVLKNSEFLLMDEPTNDLDEKMSDEIVKIMLEEKDNGRGVILVTHNNELSQIADVNYSLVNGQLTTV